MAAGWGWGVLLEGRDYPPFFFEREDGGRCSLCISKSQLIFPVREQWDLDPPHTPPPTQALLNVIPPLAPNHLHYSSEAWISPRPALPYYRHASPLGSHCSTHVWTVRLHLRGCSLILREQLLDSQFMLETCLPRNMILQWKTWPPLPGWTLFNLQKTRLFRGWMLFMIHNINAAMPLCDIMCICFNVLHNMSHTARTSLFIRVKCGTMTWLVLLDL